MKLTAYLIPGNPGPSDPLGQRAFAVIATEKEASLIELDATVSQNQQRARAALSVAMDVWFALGGTALHKDEFATFMLEELGKAPNTR